MLARASTSRSIPIDDLTAGEPYTLRLGNQLADLGGQPVAPTTVTFTPAQTARGAAPIAQVLRTRQAGDPGPARRARAPTPNVIAVDKPLIGSETSTMLPATLAAELGDPKALGGPIAFTIRKGQRLLGERASTSSSAAQIPSGLTTGDIMIELLTDAGGRLYRNPYQPDDQRPENDRAPLYVDLSMDVAVYAIDPTGNAVLDADRARRAGDGHRDRDRRRARDRDRRRRWSSSLLGVTAAPTNLVLELITDAHGDGRRPTRAADARRDRRRARTRRWPRSTAASSWCSTSRSIIDRAPRGRHPARDTAGAPVADA